MAWTELYRMGKPLWKIYADFYKLRLALTKDGKLHVKTMDGSPLANNPGLQWLIKNKNHAIDRLRHEGDYSLKCETERETFTS